MSTTPFSWDLFNKVPIVGVIRNHTLEEVKQILPLYYEAGLTTIEITMNTDQPGEIIRYASENFLNQLNIGAGTVCDEEELEQALNAGAQFIVTPVINKKVIKTCVKKNIPIFPGAYTPSEIYKAWSLGAAIVKIFPATSLGPEYIKDLKAQLNKLKVMPTGGVSLENLPHFRQAGADGFGIGGQLIDKKLIRDKNWPALLNHFKAFVSQFKTSMTNS